MAPAELAAQLEAWAEELAALESIYAEDLEHDADCADASALAELAATSARCAPPVCFSIRLDGGGADLDALPPGEVRLGVKLGSGYPHGGALPRFELVHDMRAHVLSAVGGAAVLAQADAAARAALESGEACTVYMAAAAANEALAEGRWREDGGGHQPPAAVRGGAEAGEGEGAEEEEGCEGEGAHVVGARMDEAATAAIVRRVTDEALEAVGPLRTSALLGEGGDEGGASLRGVWPYRVGLVGKPSAGKSSLFNALTRAGMATSACAGVAPAKVGAAPFTTLDPNLGPALWAAPSCSEPHEVAQRRVPTSHGRTADGRRLLPCTLIDVAGLVPGAYTGRGKGNQFLADLTTAEALVHVVDASGQTDRGGNPTERAFGALSIAGSSEGADSADADVDEASSEIEWVRAEIHLWVFTNVAAKRHAWRKRPEKLGGMFTGYGCSPALVQGVMRRAALCAMKAAAAAAQEAGAATKRLGATLQHDSVALMARLAAGSESELHRLVAHFVATRWPIAIALNKADAPAAAARVAACRRRFPTRCMVPTSARSELALLRAADGEACGSALPAAEAASEAAEHASARRMVEAWGSTGVEAVLSACIALRPPTLVYPVRDIATLAPLGVQGEEEAPLRDCLQLKPLSTVGDAFQAAKRAGLCAGDLVRAEIAAAADVGSGQPTGRPIKAEDSVGCGHIVLRLQSTRKSVWQQRPAS